MIAETDNVPIMAGRMLGSRVLGTVAYLGGVASVPEEFCWSWGQMIQYNSEQFDLSRHHVHYERAKVSYHSLARNSLAEHMQGNWLLQLDADLEFEPDVLVRLLHRMSQHQADVVTGVYVTGGKPHLPVIYGKGEDGGPYRRILDVRETDVFPVHAAGGGILLVKRDVFKRIREETGEQPFDIRGQYSEDFSFFERCHQVGAKVICDQTCNPGHLRNRAYYLEDREIDYADLRYEELPK